MRELAKTMFGFSMAMTLFGMQQIRNLVGKEQKDEEEVQGGDQARGKEEGPDDRTKTIKDDLESITRATDQRLSKRAHDLFESGDRFQREMTDYLFDFLDDGWWKPTKVVEKTADIADKSAEILRKSVEDKDSNEEKGDKKTGGAKAAQTN